MINILWLRQKLSKSFVLPLISFMLVSGSLYSAPEKELPKTEAHDLDNVRKILKNDKLEEEAQKKLKAMNDKKSAEKVLVLQKYNLPQESEFWSFISELFLVKKAQLLKWDFVKPDYGLQSAVEELFKHLGFYEKKLKILLLNTPEVTHFALPANKNEYIFLVSVPFIRTMDLNKLEISLILLEDFFRSENGYFINYAREKDLDKYLGTNFYEKKENSVELLKLIDKILKSYETFIFSKGFNFQQQFEVTNKMNQILKGNKQLWNGYASLLAKIDKLVQSNLLYKTYNNIYPSPEMQIKWISPK